MANNPKKYDFINISELKPYENNARTHSNKQIELICNSLKEFGFINPVIIDENNVILVGHGRIEAAKVLGIETAPFRRITNLTDDQKRAYILADNKLSDLGGWNEDILAAELENINLDMGAFGFDSFNIDISEPETPPEFADDGFTPPDDSEEIESRVKPGEIWRLGEHLLYCADSTDKQNVEKLLNVGGYSLAENDKQPAPELLCTDPPYNMDYGGGGGFMLERKQKLRKRIIDIIDFNARSIAWLAETDIKTCFIFTSKDLLFDYFDIFKSWGFNLLVWYKTNPPPFLNNTFFPDLEYILYFYKDGARVWNNNIRPIEIYHKCFISDCAAGQKDAGGKVHPTIKPLQLIREKIQIASTRGGAVLDMFGGSGTTLIACEQTGRNCFMLEITPKYCEIIIQRFEKFTGKKAEKLTEV